MNSVKKRRRAVVDPHDLNGLRLLCEGLSPAGH